MSNFGKNNLISMVEEDARLFKLEDGSFIITESDIQGVATTYNVDIFEAFGMILEHHDLLNADVGIIFEMAMNADQLEAKIEELEDSLETEKTKKNNEPRIRTLTNIINNYKKQLQAVKAKESEEKDKDRKRAG